MSEINIDSSNIDRAVTQLRRYATLLDRKSEKIVSGMLYEGANEAANNFGHVATGETLSSINTERNGKSGTITVGGNAIWFEFGTGVIANRGGNEHPKKAELNLAPWGTYGKGYGSDPQGWWFKGDDGEWHHTYGIKATMFFYNTAQMLRREYARIAKKEFK